jgi:hypothetical protein
MNINVPAGGCAIPKCGYAFPSSSLSATTSVSSNSSAIDALVIRIPSQVVVFKECDKRQRSQRVTPLSCHMPSPPPTPRRASIPRPLPSPSPGPPSSITSPRRSSTPGLPPQPPSTPPPNKTRARDLLRKHYGLGVGPPPPLPGRPNDPMDLGKEVSVGCSY